METRKNQSQLVKILSDIFQSQAVAALTIEIYELVGTWDFVVIIGVKRSFLVSVYMDHMPLVFRFSVDFLQTPLQINPCQIHQPSPEM
jgi:hypothetical protein